MTGFLGMIGTRAAGGSEIPRSADFRITPRRYAMAQLAGTGSDASADSVTTTDKSAWVDVFGGRGGADGNASTSSASQAQRIYGVAAGVDRDLSPRSAIGLALAGGESRVRLSDGAGSMDSNFIQGAVYGTARARLGYVRGAVAYGAHRVHANRSTTAIGVEQLLADFTAHNVAVRVEVGYQPEE